MSACCAVLLRGISLLARVHGIVSNAKIRDRSKVALGILEYILVCFPSLLRSLKDSRLYGLRLEFYRANQDTLPIWEAQDCPTFLFDVEIARSVETSRSSPGSGQDRQ